MAAAVAVELDFAEARRQRAESADFEWSVWDGRNICANTETNKAYVVTETSCTCPDWTYRGSKSGTACKHQVALRLRNLEAGL